jgi:hypothetical protein
LVSALALLEEERTGAFPRWLATYGLLFAPILAISRFAFPLDSDVLYTSLALSFSGHSYGLSRSPL